MVLRPPRISALLLALRLILGGLALLIPRGEERLVARATSKLSAEPLRDCLASKLGLTFTGDARALHASAFGLRVVLTDNLGPRADMTASWLAQMGCEVLVLDWPADIALETGADAALPPRGPERRYKRPYERTDNAAAAKQADLDWEFGLVEQLRRDGTCGFYVI